MNEAAVNLKVATRDFKYYIFDWDDNILHMATRIHFENRQPDGGWRLHKVSTAAFTILRKDTENWRPPGGDWERAFTEFRDHAGESESQFLSDTRTALEKVMRGEAAPGPSFDALRETLREGRLFAIVTARGHEEVSLKKAVRLFIDVVLTPEERREMVANLRGYRACFDHYTEPDSDEQQIDYYLGKNLYCAVTNPSFKRRMEAEGNVPRPEEAKQFAFKNFIDHVVRILEETGAAALKRSISVGFSDDDTGNVKAIVDYIQSELSARFPNIKFCVYDTSNPALPARKLTVSGQLGLEFPSKI
ncbi:MAG: hypothetical protein J6Z49_09205 [Kiritimatiellae bacterium]|nr:hypothetical protein [Kiritimatiellia bacterium]